VSNMSNKTMPLLSGVDHCHINVNNLSNAVTWYEKVLGFKVVEELAFWDETGKGPLTLQDQNTTTRLALFEGQVRSKGIAFGATGEQFIAWLAHFKSMDIKTVLADHGVTFSIYFKDDSDNSHEITSHDYEHIKMFYPSVEQGSHSAKKS